MYVGALSRIATTTSACTAVSRGPLCLRRRCVCRPLFVHVSVSCAVAAQNAVYFVIVSAIAAFGVAKSYITTFGAEFNKLQKKNNDAKSNVDEAKAWAIFDTNAKFLVRRLSVSCLCVSVSASVSAPACVREMVVCNSTCDVVHVVVPPTRVLTRPLPRCVRPCRASSSSWRSG
jgi:hypothetical protein